MPAAPVEVAEGKQVTLGEHAPALTAVARDFVSLRALPIVQSASR
jgi:hypothetical protein